MVCVRRASAGAVQLCPAVGAFRVRINVAGAEFVLNLFVCDPVPYVAETEFFISHKLVAGIKITPRRDCHVLRPGAAAGYPLVNAGTSGQIDHVVIEGERLSGTLPLKHQLRKLLVL